jgi:hypothetical protein
MDRDAYFARYGLDYYKAGRDPWEVATIMDDNTVRISDDCTLDEFSKLNLSIWLAVDEDPSDVTYFLQGYNAGIRTVKQNARKGFEAALTTAYRFLSEGGRRRFEDALCSHRG